MTEHLQNIRDLLIYTKCFEYWDKMDGIGTDRDRSEKTKIPASSIRMALQRLRERYGFEFHAIPSNGGPRELTDDARQLYRLAKEVGDACGRACEWRRCPAFPVLRVGATAGILFHLLPDVVARIMQTCSRQFALDLRLFDRPGSVAEAVAVNAIDLGFATHVLPDSFEERAVAKSRGVIDVEVLPRTLQPVAVFPAVRTLVSKHGQAGLEIGDVCRSRHGSRMFALPADRYPRLFRQLQVAAKEHEERVIEAPGLGLILTLVAAGLGVAVVPGFCRRLKEFNLVNPRSRHIRFIPVVDMDPIQLAALRRNGSNRQTMEHVNAFLSMVKDASHESE